MKKFLYIFVLLTVLSSCSEYHKALKSEDIATKFKMGEDLFKEGKYSKANKLFAQIVPSYRGKPQAEKLMYLYSLSFYEMKDYYLAGYQCERFASSYPNSEKIEEVSFTGAKSYYMLSPVYTKDQEDTTKAIEKLQEFINLFPVSSYSAEANTLVKELDFKLENKAFGIAKQYNHISDYDASIKSFDNFIFDFPGSTLFEDALFYRLDSAYKLGMNSVEYKKQNRLETAKSYANALLKRFNDSKYKEEVNNMLIELDGLLIDYTSTAKI